MLKNEHSNDNLYKLVIQYSINTFRGEYLKKQKIDKG